MQRPRQRSGQAGRTAAGTAQAASAGSPQVGAHCVEDYRYEQPPVGAESDLVSESVGPVLTTEGELERATAQLAAVFPGFLSIAAPAGVPQAVDAHAARSDAAGQPIEEQPEAGNEAPESSPLWQQGWETGHMQGREEGWQQAREELAVQDQDAAQRLQQTAQQQVIGALDAFSVERERYFHELEQEAVRLALAIAARILRREAQMDPLLLSGAVRVALGQLGESTAVRLIVPEADRVLWEESLRLTPGLRLRPEVVGDARMELGECRIQTEFGGADLSLHEQLREIERGFFDRLPQRAAAESVAARPAAVARPAAAEQAPFVAEPMVEAASTELAGNPR